MTEVKVNNGGAPAASPAKEVSIYDQAMKLVNEMVPQDKFKFSKANSGTSIFDNGGGRGTRLLKVVDSKKGLRVEFNVNVEAKLKDVASSEKVIYSEADAKAKHMGTCRWIYTGKDLKVLKELVQTALAGFSPKVREEKKDEPKAETPATPAAEVKPAAEAPKQEPVKEEPPKGTRKLSDEEKKQLGATGSTIKYDPKAAKAQ